MKNKKNIIAVAVIILATFVFSGSVSGIANPAAVYCKDLGYEYTIESSPEGEYGVCHLPDGSTVDEWKFLTGEVGKKYSYCQKEGYEMKIIESSRDFMCPYSTQCIACVLENGEEIEVTELMDLDVETSVCGDGECVLGENHKTCPKDCPSGFSDMYCDGVKDGLCDPDCAPAKDSDCVGKTTSIDVAICADKNCLQKSKSFAQGETVYFRINNHIGSDISSTIKTPGGEIKQLIFEGDLAAFQSKELGKFSLWMNFLEEGYKERKIEKDFVYVEKKEIEEVPVCNVNGKCEAGENRQNCPQDCTPAVKKENSKFYILATAILLIIIIAVAVLYRRKSRN